MFIIKTQTNKHKDTKYYTTKLVENFRTPTNKIRRRTLLNLGQGYSGVDESEWQALTTCIEEMLAGTMPLLEMPEHIEKEASRIANLLIKKHGKEIATPNRIKHFETIDIESLENSDVKSVGAEHLSHEMAKKLHLPDILSQAGFNQKQTHLALATIIGRLLSPGSEVATCDYLRNKSALDEVMGVDFSRLSKNQLYDISDLLLKHKEKIEKDLFEHEKTVLQFEETVTLFDLTNTYFEGQSKKNDNAALGRSKEKRSDCVLVSLALVLDASGFPKHSHIYQGNISEPNTLEKMLQPASKKAIVVMDAGIATEDNIAWLTEHNYKYLVVSRKRNQEIPENIAGVVVKEDSYNKVTTYLVKATDGAENELYCHSEAMEAKGTDLIEKFKTRFTDALTIIKNGLSKKGGTKKYAKICERIGRLKEKHKQVAHRYTIQVVTDEKKTLVTEITWEYQTKDTGKSAGIYCIRTNQTQMDNHMVWKTYRMLNDVESAFRTLKTDLGMRPVYHQKTDRVTGHIFISLLAYHLLHAIRYHLKNHKINDSWETIMSKLSNHYRITTSAQCKEGNIIHVRKSMRPSPEQLKIYQACDVSTIPLKTIITAY